MGKNPLLVTEQGIVQAGTVAPHQLFHSHVDKQFPKHSCDIGEVFPSKLKLVDYKLDWEIHGKLLEYGVKFP